MRDDMYTDSVSGHNFLYPKGRLGQLLGVHHRVTRFTSTRRTRVSGNKLSWAPLGDILLSRKS